MGGDAFKTKRIRPCMCVGEAGVVVLFAGDQQEKRHLGDSSTRQLLFWPLGPRGDKPRSFNQYWKRPARVAFLCNPDKRRDHGQGSCRARTLVALPLLSFLRSERVQDTRDRRSIAEISSYQSTDIFYYRPSGQLNAQRSMLKFPTLVFL